MDNRNESCGVHGQHADIGMLQAHDAVKEVLPDAEVWAQVPLKSEGTHGRALESGQFCRTDLVLDMLVRCANGVFFAIEVSGREHKVGQGPERDRKKAEYLKAMHVPLIVLHLSSARAVPLTTWREKLHEVQYYGRVGSGAL